MKNLFLTVQGDNDNERSYVLEGDRRQTNDRMIELGVRKIAGGPVVKKGEDHLFKHQETGQTFNVTEHRLLDEEEASEIKKNHITLVINENVTENACRVGYSGPY